MSSNNIDTEKMFTVGTHYGYSKSRRHPSTSPYIFGTKNGIDIINIEKTLDLLEGVISQVENLGATGKIILFVGTKPESRESIAEIASSLGMPYVTERWVGGMLTNFPEIKKRIAKLVEFKDQKEKDGFEKYTKKERLLINREIEDMERNFQGLVGLTKTPDVLFVVDPKKEHIAVKEAIKIDIPVIALANTDCNIKEVTYPIVANDASVSSISFFVNEIKKAYERGSSGENK